MGGVRRAARRCFARRTGHFIDPGEAGGAALCRPVGQGENVSVSPPREAPASTLFDDLRDAVAVTARSAADGTALPWCRSGALLRALLLVHGSLALGLLPASDGLRNWLMGLAAAAAVALPATLAWVLLACRLGPRLAPRLGWEQRLAASVAGALCAGLASWPVEALGLLSTGAFGLGAIAAVGAGLGGLLMHLALLRQKARLPAAAAARLADLQTRIRPHFLFNTLNTAITLVQLDPRRAEEVLEDLSDLFRAALGALDQPTTLGDELLLGRRYLAIESLRFGRRLDVFWDLDPMASGARVPPLILQPLIENAVRHGIEPADGPGHIEVRTRRRRDRVLVSVTNTVAPADAPLRPGHGIGLASVRERLRLMHDLDTDFHHGPIEDGRYRVSFGVPA